MTRESWTAALLALGVIPRHADPQAGSVPLDKAIVAMEQLVAEIDAAVAGVPDYATYLSRLS